MGERSKAKTLIKCNFSTITLSLLPFIRTLELLERQVNRQGELLDVRTHRSIEIETQQIVHICHMLNCKS